MQDHRSRATRVLAVVATLAVALSLFVASAPPANAEVSEAQPLCYYGEFTLSLADYGCFSRGGRATTPICIETDLAQAQDPALRTSNIFRDNDTVYLIISSGPTCTFNCHNGWDINCDGKLGDFCPVELDRERVGDVGKCLASLGTTPTTYVG